MMRVIGLFKLFRKELAEMLFALFNPKTPGKIRGAMLLVILYFFSPIDLIPDTIPVLGILDDAIVVPMAINVLMRLLPESVKRDSEIRAWKYQRYVPIVFGVAGLMVLFWIFLILYGLYKLIF